MSKPRVVLDTNLLVSASLRRNSVPRQVFDLAFRHGEVLTSTDTLAELKEVLTRKKFDRYVSEDKRLRFLANFLHLSTPIRITKPVVACRDPKDDKFLALAVSGGAEYLVSGDMDLLTLHPFHGVSIVTPTDFLNAFAESSG